MTYNFKYFDSLIELLQKWRNADHEDMITLHRSQMIEIIEGVKGLRERIAALQGGAERYWELRWRDAHAENEGLREELNRLLDQRPERPENENG